MAHNQAFLEAYRGESIDQLIALADTHRVDSIVLAVEEALLQRKDLNATERVVVAVEALEREVNNGGFHQLFLNRPEVAPYLVSSLRLIGCEHTAQIAQRAINALAASDLSPAQIDDALFREDDLRDGAFVQCNDAYFNHVDEPIALRLFEFIRANSVQVRLGAAHAP